MTSTTSLGLRYPTGTDKPCDGWQQITDLRNDIYDRLDAQYDDLLAALDPPMAAVVWDGPDQLWVGGPMIFNTVEQDNLRAADLIVRNNGLVLGKDNDPDLLGTYIFGFSITATGVNTWRAAPDPDPETTRALDAAQYMRWEIPGQMPWMGASTLIRIQTETVIKIDAANSDADCDPPILFCPINISFARLWALRIGDV